MTLEERARTLGIHPTVIRYRIKVLGWSREKAMTTPNQMGHSNNRKTPWRKYPAIPVARWKRGGD